MNKNDKIEYLNENYTIIANTIIAGLTDAERFDYATMPSDEIDRHFQYVNAANKIGLYFDCDTMKFTPIIK